MYLEVDKLNTITGWTSDGTITAYGLVSEESFIANNNTNALIIKIPEGNLNKYITKAITAVDVTNYNELILHIWSRNKKQSSIFDQSNYNYKLVINSTKSYYIPIIANERNEVTIDISDVSSITKIEFIALHNDEDYIIVSSLCVVDEEIPLDIFKGVVASLEAEYEKWYSAGKIPEIGTISTAVNDTYISFASNNYNFAERYTLFRIAGDSVEHHHIIQHDEKKFYFSDLYDGSKIKYAHTNKKVYIRFPALYGRHNLESIVPAFVIWGITPEMVKRGTDLDNIYDTSVDTDVMKIRREGKLLRFTMLVHCQAFNYEIIAIMSKMVRNVLAQNHIWVNNREYEIRFVGIPTEIEPIQPYEMIPSIQYQFEIDYREENFDRSTLVPVTATNVDTIIQ